MVSYIETGIGLITIFIGLISIILIGRYVPELSKGALKEFCNRFAIAIVFVLCFSIWHTLREYFEWKENIGEFMEYPEYIFIVLAYISFFISARKVVQIAKLYGFEKIFQKEQ
ncbi:MAG: hypothetical protein HY929_06370 [Euryarchaeota archaeon]|nr:hypothetical protein [Euryarchaeota archaeon]